MQQAEAGGAGRTETVLDRIVARTRADLERRMEQRPLDRVITAAEAAPPPRDFLAAIRRPGQVRLIAEVKKASPRAGLIRADFDPAALARGYEAGGAAAISVLTDEPFFQGCLAYLEAVKAAVSLPVLRKDFIISEYQLYEARAAGADAVLLIAECLPQEDLMRLYELSRRLDMHVLLELYDEENLPRVLETGCPIVGVNNRDLRTFTVDLERAVRMRRSIAADRCLVSESGIAGPEQVARLRECGVDAMLVGESLSRQGDVAAAVRRLLGMPGS